MTVNKIEVPKCKKYPKGIAWELDLRQKGYSRVTRRFATQELARQIENAILTDRARAEFKLKKENRITVQALVTRHLEAVKSRPTPLAKIETILKRFVKLVGPERFVDSLDTSDMMLYINQRKRDKIANQTINREMNEVRSCLNSAWIYFKELQNYRNPRYPKLQEPEDGRRETWTEQEKSKLLADLRAPQRENETTLHVRQRLAVADLFVLCNSTGLRVGEARKLHRDQIDFTRNVMIIEFHKGKYGRKREVPIEGHVRDMLQWRAKENEWIFPAASGHKPMSTHLRVIRAACLRAKINYGTKSGGKIVNDARRTFVNAALDDNVDVRALCDTTGHSIQTMAKHYARSTDEKKRAIVKSAIKKFRHFSDAQGVPVVPNRPNQNEDEKQENAENAEVKGITDS